MNASTDALSTGALVNSSQVPAELLDSIEVGIAVLDRNFNVQVWNKFLENHGAKKAEAIIGDSLFSHFPEIEEKWLRTKVDPVFNLKSPVFIIWEQRPYLFKFGCNRPVTSAAEFMYQNVTMFPIVDKRGNVERFCMLVYDVTEQALGKRGMEHLNEELKLRAAWTVSLGYIIVATGRNALMRCTNFVCAEKSQVLRLCSISTISNALTILMVIRLGIR